MRIGNISVNNRRDRQGNPVDGLVISQRQRYLLMSREEWLELRAAADAILGTA
ncbi:hypothetical protein BH10ACT9_BH10ACT9_28380 [soil metagenome]